MSTTLSSPENVPTRLAICHTYAGIGEAVTCLYLQGLSLESAAKYSGLIIRECTIGSPETKLPERPRTGIRAIAYEDIQDGQGTALEKLKAAIIHELGMRDGPQLISINDWHSQTKLLDRDGVPKQLENGELVRLYTPFSGSILQIFGLGMNTEEVEAALKAGKVPVIRPGDVVAFTGQHRIRTAQGSNTAQSKKGALISSIRTTTTPGSIHE